MPGLTRPSNIRAVLHEDSVSMVRFSTFSTSSLHLLLCSEPICDARDREEEEEEEEGKTAYVCACKPMKCQEMSFGSC